MRSATAFAIAENVQQPGFGYIIKCRISFKLQQNEVDFAAWGKFMWSVWPFELSELCRPEVGD